MPTGLISVYDLPNGVKVNMDEAIYLYSPVDLPLLTGQDADGYAVLSSMPSDQIEFQQMTEDILVPRTHLGAAATTGDTSIQLQAGNDRLKFSTGDLIKVVKDGATEIMQVGGYSVTTATHILVTRGFDSTTATNYSSGATVIGLGTLLAEGSDPEAARAVDRDTSSNVMQIFGPTAIHASGTAQVVPRYGVPNEVSHQTAHRISENGIMREQAFLFGRKYNSTTAEKRATGGLDYNITTNVFSSSDYTQLTVTSIEAGQLDGFNRGGVSDLLIASPKSLGDLNSLTDTGRVRQEFADSRRGRVPVMTVQTEYGIVTIARNRWCHPQYAFLVTRAGIRRRILRPLQLEKLAKTGDADKWQIVCEEGLQVKGEKHMAKFSGLTAYSDAL